MTQPQIPIYDERGDNANPTLRHVPMQARDYTAGRLLDKRGRALHDIRISVTDRCNFRCTYCMPSAIFTKDHAFLPKADILSFEEICRIVCLLKPMGIRKVRITGGEPLIRHDLPTLIKWLTQSGMDISLTTNASLLEKQAAALANAGLRRITVSLDAIDDKIFRAINDVNFPVAHVIQGINKALSVGIKVKVNMVVQKGLNDTQILPMARFFAGLPNVSDDSSATIDDKNIVLETHHHERPILRFIEFMDVGETNQWCMDSVLSAQAIRQVLSGVFDLEPLAAHYDGEVAQRWAYRSKSHNPHAPYISGEFGLITSVTEPFCSQCTRLRLSANGEFFTCLFANQGHDIRSLLRNGSSDTELSAAIRALWMNRDDRYSEVRHLIGHKSATTDEVATQPQSQTTPPKKKRIEMSYIGG